MERLQKKIAQSGYCSRRKAEQLILEGQVSVNGKVIKELGTKVSEKDEIIVSGMILEKEPLVYFLFNKPKAVLSSVSDKTDRVCVTNFFVDQKSRVFPVGRLDYDTTGALIMTNDGELANAIMHPSNQITKTYIVKIKGDIKKKELLALEKGVLIDGKKTAPCKAKFRTFDFKTKVSTVELQIHEGMNHQVKKMFEAIGHPVKKLHRSEIAFLNLEGIPQGNYRKLTFHEVKKLYFLAQDIKEK